jgi:membrane protein YdbS with pleckstrin-like domain
MQETELEINRGAIRRYSIACLLLPCFVFFFFVLFGYFRWGFLSSPLTMLVLVLIVFLLYGHHPAFQFLFPQQVNNLRYRLQGSTLQVDGGVFFLFRKSIPLERITDVALVQGPLLRYFDIWAMRIQTAGSAQCEATLYGVREPEKIRELILAQRKSVYGFC